ncbi:MAG: aminodeoxychorismate/anthranilate synthase component II [Deltaproteobacteria bacterium]|nr:aminodeoxychorismate/anthranilate synthase component II [Deltaproteobacteria bacterium]
MGRLLVVDNYDSFTYNLVHLVKKIGTFQVEVVRNDKFALDQVAEYDKILLSPGPGLPCEAGLMPDLVRRYADSKSILGVCLGHQCIGEVFGAKLFNLGQVAHGKGLPVRVLDPAEPLFRGLPQSFVAGRYNSWVVAREGFPECLKITAEDEAGWIMALSHRQYDLKGVQFHPESVLTEQGEMIIRNWLER